MLSERPTYIVPPEGPTDAKIALIGEAPGEQEIREGRPFAGPAGRLLDRLLIGAGIQRSNCYVTNVIKERPPTTGKKTNDITTFLDLTKKSGPVETDAFHVYVEDLKKELEEVNPNIIIAFGNVPIYALTGLYPTKVTKRRGSVYPCSLVPGLKVIATIHPSACLHGGDSKGMYIWQHFIVADLRKAIKESAYPEIRDDGWEYIISPTYDECMHFLTFVEFSNELVGYDIEVVNLETSCISFATKKKAISIPFAYNGKPYFPPDQERDIMIRIAEVLQMKHIIYVGQNLAFDVQFLHRKYGIVPPVVEDTMIAQAILAPDFPKGLDFITSAYTNTPYYKDEGKQYMKVGGNDEDFWLYNAKDSAVCVEAHPKIMDQLRIMNNEVAYERKKRIIPILSYMSERGVRIDVENIKAESERVGGRIEELNERLNRMCGYEINAASPAQLIDYFYNRKGIKPYKNRKTGKATTDVDALKRLARKGIPEASVLLEIRKLAKLKGTYLDVPLDPDNRLRCSFNPVGTETGRLSSGINIWGTGTNMQNLPVTFKQFMLADDGYAMFEMDLSQAENRIVAYVSPEPTMIDAFEMGIDVHSLTGGLISGLDPVEVKRQHKENIMCNLGQGMQSWRFWGKKANHGLNYDLGYKAFSFIYEIPENDGKFIVSRYHQAYPGIRQYHQSVQSMLMKDRIVTNLMERKRLFMDRWGDQLFKEAYAQIPQSTVADVIDERGLIHIYENQQTYKPVELLDQIHDSIIFQIPISIGWEKIAFILSSIKLSLEQPLVWKMKEFVIPVGLKMGTRLAEHDPINAPLGDMVEVDWHNIQQNLEEAWKTNT